MHVTSPKGKIIKPGDSIILRNEGMPVYKNPDHKGHLYVILEVDMPDEQWLKSIDTKVRSALSFMCQAVLTNHDAQTLEAILPPKKAEMEPKPAVIDEVPFEEGDIVDVRATPFAGSNFFDHGFDTQFGEGDGDGWEDDEDDEDDEHGEPECRPQ